MLEGNEHSLFNPGFIDKSELYNLFKKHPFLHTFLPATIPAKNKQKLSAFLSQYQSIYLKPSQSARGNGIFKLELDTAHRVLLKGLNENDEFVTFDSFWKEWERRLVEKNYLAQEEIKPVLYEGKRFDFRILAHAEKIIIRLRESESDNPKSRISPPMFLQAGGFYHMNNYKTRNTIFLLKLLSNTLVHH